MRLATWILAAILLFLAAAVSARPPENSLSKRIIQREYTPPLAPGVSDRSADLPAYVPASASTTVLYSATFDSAGGCVSEGWTAVDLTAQSGDYYHVDDYAGLSFGPLAGTKSLWCGARPSSTGPLCHYATLPGYGNGWDQSWETKACIPVSGDLDVAADIRVDMEPGWDALSLEYTTDCSGETGWTLLDGGIGVWDTQTFSLAQAYNVGGATSVRVRFHVFSDGAWSDEDGQWQTTGAAHIDNLAVENLALEDFEGAAVDAHATQDWESVPALAYGNFAGLVHGQSVLQSIGGGCTQDVTCLWAFFVGSSSNYACGGYPLQQTVPYLNARGQYIHNEIWSPLIDLSQSGNQLILEFKQYADFTQNSLVFPIWSVRPIVSGCGGDWITPIIYFYYPSGWTLERHPIGAYVNTNTATEMQISLGVIDMCAAWCGVYGDGSCHSHTPLYDDVRVYRVDGNGPQWAIRDTDQFQDGFEEISGPSAGHLRADMANDIAPGNHANSIIPGDSSVVKVWDFDHGLGADPGAGGAAVYCYVSVSPPGQPGKSGASIVDDAMRWPVVGTWTDASGTLWTCVRLDSCRVDGIAQPDLYCVDLRDDLFEAGDIVSFFYAAKNAIGQETYAFGSNLALTGDNREQAALDPSEFTGLPVLGGPSTDILYVDGMDGRGAQPFWDTAFEQMGVPVDRYDVRGPASAVSNRLAGRVRDLAQLNDNYRIILWDCGNLAVTLGDGTGSPEKTDDYQLLDDFLANLSGLGALYIGGDDVPSQLDGYSGTGALIFRNTYMTCNLVTSDHRPLYGVSPTGTAVPGGMFISDASVTLFGGCPLLNDFDVMQPTGITQNQLTYGPGTATSDNGAVLFNVNGYARTCMSGFSFIYIRDDDTDGTLDRAAFLFDILETTGTHNPPTPAPGVRFATTLSQNYPNPFNPQTTVAFSLAARQRVRVGVYDVSGRLVRMLVDEVRNAGAHDVTWDGRTAAGELAASGVYFCKLASGDVTRTRKMVLLK